jgi:ABC-type transport system involved in multi-copper enzyme maturation permease subunit
MSGSTVPMGVLLANLLRAESRKLLSRLSARAGLLVAAGLGLAVPGLLIWLANSDMMINGTPMADQLDASATMGLSWALSLRNFFVLRVFLIMLGALSLAGELQARTLREDLIRPVPRWAILVAKWGALSLWSAMGLALTWVVATVVGLLAFGVGDSAEWGQLAAGFAATWLTDVGFAALVLCAAAAFRSVSGTIVGVFLFFVVDTVIGFALTFLAFIAGVADLPEAADTVLVLRPWLPNAAFGAWKGFGEEGWIWQSFASLGLITVLVSVVTERLFARTDVH